MNSIMMLYSAFMSSALVIALFLSLSVTRISRCYAPEILGPAGTWVYTNYVFVTDRWTENLKSRNCWHSRVGWWISEVCADWVILKHFAREITFQTRSTYAQMKNTGKFNVIFILGTSKQYSVKIELLDRRKNRRIFVTQV